jgi:pyrroline-5-carboxylate reductase
MNAKAPSIGFVGGGRITAILLSALARNPGVAVRAVVSDSDPEVRRRLLSRFPGLAVGTDNMEPARQDVVFLALHAPALRKAVPEIVGALTPSAVVVSLAPIVTLAELSRLLGGFARVVRMIPNAPSLVGDGFNPTAYSPAVTARDREVLAGIFSAFGRYPEVAEEKLEAYAVLTAMGPTYLWFQLEVLRSLATSFGLTKEEAEYGLAAMAHGTIRLLLESGLPFAEVEDTVPVKPLAEDAPAIVNAYQTRLTSLYRKLTGKPNA